MSGGARSSAGAELLRHDFDASFTRSARRADAVGDDLLLIRVGGDPYALRLVECAALHVDRKVTPLPAPAPELLGLAGFRGALVPVYDLRALLGYPPGDPTRWMVSTAGTALVALAFDAFDAHVRVDPAALVASEAPAKRHALRVAHLPTGARPLLSVASLLAAIEMLAKPTGSERSKER